MKKELNGWFCRESSPPGSKNGIPPKFRQENESDKFKTIEKNYKRKK